jgi:hypothetical protein
MGERQNCISNHSAESCILPIKNAGVHQNKTGSQKAIEIYAKLLEQNPKDYESMWLLNIAYMTLGEYPAKVPQQWLIPNLDKDNSGYSIKPLLILPQIWDSTNEIWLVEPLLMILIMMVIWILSLLIGD